HDRGPSALRSRHGAGDPRLRRARLVSRARARGQPGAPSGRAIDFGSRHGTLCRPGAARPGGRDPPGERRYGQPGSPADSVMVEPRVLIDGIVFGEQPRWHEGRLWFSDWGAREIISVGSDGNREIMLEAPAFSCCVDWLLDGRMLIVSSHEGRLLRREPDGGG